MKRAASVSVIALLLVASLWASTLFSPTNMTSQVLPTPFVATASSAFPDNPCPALPTTCGGASYTPDGPFKSTIGGGSWTGMNNGTDYLKIDLGAGVLWTLDNYKLTVNTTNRGPKDWTIQGSTDDSSYTTLDTETSQTSWSTGVEVSFTVNGGVTTPYRYFKFNVTANQGIAYTEVGDLKYYGHQGGGGVKHRVIA